MTKNKAYFAAEAKIAAARKSGVTELNLRAAFGLPDSEKLTELPESLCWLTQLKMLDLHYNQLATLPEWLGGLTQLQSLNISDNKLTTLQEWLSGLAQLQSLDLSGNRLTALPEWMERLTQLRLLNVSRNELATLPKWLGKCTQLQSLGLGHNRLMALPEWLDGLAQLQSLDVSRNELTTLPEWLGGLTELQSLDVSHIGMTTLPEWLSGLTQLQWLSLNSNKLTMLPESVSKLTQLQHLSIYSNHLTLLPDSIGDLACLTELDVTGNQLVELPDSLGNCSQLSRLLLGDETGGNNIADLPVALSQLEHLNYLYLDKNPLNPELAAAYDEGIDSVKDYLRAKTGVQIILNEAKLILIGEGEVGKSCLLGALRGDPWEGGRPTTHGIEIKPVKVLDRDTGAEIVLNGWDFGGQRVYRPTHQLFFSAPAVYLVVWKPREGPQAGAVKEWVKLVKHREPEAKIIVVATHGGPGERQPDIDRQELWDLFGRNTLVDFFHVDSKPDEKTGNCDGIAELRDAIARVAVGLPEVGRQVPKHWHEARKALTTCPEAYLTLDRVLAICKEYRVGKEEAHLLLRICRRVGDLIHYEHDPALHDIVVLKPNWLATAISFVLDDKETRDGHGLVSFSRLHELWDDQARLQEFRYDAQLHPLFLRLMERFDISYKVSLPNDATDEIRFWQRIGSLFGRTRLSATVPEIRYTSLIAQLVPDVRPEEGELQRVWPLLLDDGDEQQMQICRIVDARNGQSAPAEGLFYQLIVRLHRFSLGRLDFNASVHWQRGLVLDDEYNGRALLEHVGNDVRITVRAAYPERFLSVLTHEVEWLVKNFWEGLRCDVMVPCVEPCGLNAPGSGLFEVEKLIKSKKRGEYPCSVCNEWQDINCLLRNAPAARRMPIESLINDRFDEMKSALSMIHEGLVAHDRKELLHYRELNRNDQRILSEVDDAYSRLLRTLTDEAKEGPRLFSLYPVERSAFNPSGWTKKQFRITLWCEHTRLPLPFLNKNDREGVYEFDVTREWFAKAAPFLKVLAGTLSLVLPVAASAAKLALDETTYKGLEKQLDFGKSCAEAMFKAGEKSADWLTDTEGEQPDRAGVIRAYGGVLREFQTWLKQTDPGYGDLRRVLNKQKEFMWVHRDYESEY